MSTPERDEAMREAASEALRRLMPDLLAEVLGNQPTGDGGSVDRAPNGNGAGGHLPGATNGNGAASSHPRDGDIQPAAEPDLVPLVPAPPVAAVLRPSTWSGPVRPGEVVGNGEVTAAVVPATPAGATAHPSSALSAGGAASPSEIGPSQAAAASNLAAPAARPSRPVPAGATIETVRIDSDEDLQAFVRSLVTRLESPRDRLAVKAGRLRFHLQRSSVPVGAQMAQATPAVHVPRGAVTERHVRDAHSNGARLVLARAAVLTPLARETARTLGVTIEREAQC